MKTLLTLLILLFSLGVNGQKQPRNKKRHKIEKRTHRSWYEVKKRNRIHGELTFYKQGWGWNNYLSCATVYSGQPIKRSNMKKQHYASNRQSKKR